MEANHLSLAGLALSSSPLSAYGTSRWRRSSIRPSLFPAFSVSRHGAQSLSLECRVSGYGGLGGIRAGKVGECRGLSDSAMELESDGQGEAGQQNSVVRGVVFDMDGVLCDSEGRSRDAAVALFAELGVTVTAADFIPFTGTGEANFLGEVARKYGLKQFDVVAAKKRFFQIYIEKYALPNSGLGYPGALDFILQCKNAGLKLVVASSADSIKVNANLAAADLALTNFDAVIAADLFENLKPAPDIFLAAAKAIGLPPHECVVIEDALAGVQAARAAGMRCIGVTTTLSEEKLWPAGPSLVRSDISQISLEDVLFIKGGKAGPDEELDVGDKNFPSVVDGAMEAIKNFREGLDEELLYPIGFMTTRRDVLKLGSLLSGVSSIALIASHWKALSYISPKAIWNGLVGVSRPVANSSVMTSSQRIEKLTKYIADMENK